MKVYKIESIICVKKQICLTFLYTVTQHCKDKTVKLYLMFNSTVSQIYFAYIMQMLCFFVCFFIGKSSESGTNDFFRKRDS